MNGFHSETAGHWFAEVFLERYVDMNAKITPIKPNGDAIPCWERNCGREGEGDVITFLDLRILRHDADAPTPTCTFCIHLHNVRRIPKSCDGVRIEQTFQKTVSKNVFFHFGHNSSIYLLRSYPAPQISYDFLVAPNHPPNQFLIYSSFSRENGQFHIDANLKGWPRYLSPPSWLLF